MRFQPILQPINPADADLFSALWRIYSKWLLVSQEAAILDWLNRTKQPFDLLTRLMPSALKQVYLQERVLHTFVPDWLFEELHRIGPAAFVLQATERRQLASEFDAERAAKRGVRMNMEYLLPEAKRQRLQEIRGADTTELGEEVALLRLVAEQQIQEGQNLAAVQTVSAVARVAERNLQMQITDRRLISCEQVGSLMKWTSDLLFSVCCEKIGRDQAVDVADSFAREWSLGFSQFRASGIIPKAPEVPLLPAPEPAGSPVHVTGRFSRSGLRTY